MYFNIVLPKDLKIYKNPFSVQLTFFNNYISSIKYEMIIDPTKASRFGDDNYNQNNDKKDEKDNKNKQKPIDTIKINYLDYNDNSKGKIGTIYWSRKNNTLLYTKNQPDYREPISIILVENKDDTNGMIIPNSDLWKELRKNMTTSIINCSQVPIRGTNTILWQSVHVLPVRPRSGQPCKRIQAKRKKKEVISACKKPL